MFIFLQAYRGVPTAMFSAMIFIALVVFLIPFIFYLITLQNTLKAIAPENCKMEPGNVWLMFIPIFYLIWHFIIVNRMADSIQMQLNKAGVQVTGRPAQGIGIAMCVLFCCSIIPVLGYIATLGGLVCWIIYWIKIAEFKRQIESLPRIQDNDSEIFGAKYY